MTTQRIATTQWSGSLTGGKGTVTFRSSNIGTFPITWKSRSTAEADHKTSPEELIAAAHSSCFAMALSHEITEAGYTIENISVSSDITFTPGIGITGDKLTVTAAIPNISDDVFQKIAETAKNECPVSKALTGLKITLEATLD